MVRLAAFQRDVLIRLLALFTPLPEIMEHFRKEWGIDLPVKYINQFESAHDDEINKLRRKLDDSELPRILSKERLLKEIDLTIQENDRLRDLVGKRSVNLDEYLRLNDFKLKALNLALKTLSIRRGAKADSRRDVYDKTLEQAMSSKEALKDKVMRLFPSSPVIPVPQLKIGDPPDHFVTVDEMKELVRDYILTGVDDDDDLYFFILHVMGYKIPRVPYCAHHSAPFTMIADCFFDRVDNILVMANRTGGKTRNFSLIHFLDMVFKHGCEINHAGAVRAQADQCKKYVNEYKRRPWLSWLFPSATGGVIEVNALGREDIDPSSLEIITASIEGFNSKHPHKCSVDEVELISWDLLQQQFSMTQTKEMPAGWKRGEPGPIFSRDLYGSTRKTSVGTMQRLLDEAQDRRMKVISWCIWDVLERCDRECGEGTQSECPVWSKCRGRAKHLSGSGFYTIRDFIKKAKALDDSTFEAEWECKRPSSEKHIYLDRPFRFHPDYNWKKRFSIPKDWETRSGCDFGYEDPFAYVKVARSPEGIFYVYFEHKAPGQLLEWHADIIRHSPGYQDAEIIYADTSAKQERAELAALGFPTVEAIRDVEPGINAVKRLMRFDPSIDSCRLIVFDDMWMLAKEIRGYVRDDQNRVAKRQDDHLLDALRYVIKGWTDDEGYAFDEYELKQAAMAEEFATASDLTCVVESLQGFDYGYDDSDSVNMKGFWENE